MKKIILTIASIALFVACGNNTNNTSAPEEVKTEKAEVSKQEGHPYLDIKVSKVKFNEDFIVHIKKIDGVTHARLCFIKVRNEEFKTYGELSDAQSQYGFECPKDLIADGGIYLTKSITNEYYEAGEYQYLLYEGDDPDSKLIDSATIEVVNE